MKNKRLLSLVLCICLTMSLFVGLGATASADTTTDNYFSYTVQSGDWLSKICTRYGLNYWTAKDAIMILNGFTSTTQCDRITPGQVIKLPNSNEAAATIKATGSATSTTTTTTTTGSTTTTTTTSTVENLNSNDWVAGYLVAHTMTSGESLYSVCNSLGVSYTNTVAKIVAINGLSNPNNVWVGKTIYVPVSTRPSSGTYYVIVGHTVMSGDTMTALCSNYGVSFSKNYTMLEGLNGTTNLNRILAGYTVYIPALSSLVVKTVTTTSTTSSSSSSSSSSTTSTGYNINFGSTSEGAPYATVSGTTVTKADAGKTVTIVPNANTGYAQETISVANAAGAKITVTNNTFIMPAGDVTVNVTYSIAKGIICHKATHGTVTAKVDGVQVAAAAMGKKVTVNASPENGYEVASVSISYKNGTETVSKAVDKNSNGTYIFTMPDAETTITATFKAVDLWSVTASTTGGGSVTAEIDGSPISAASAGQSVYVKTTAESGYTLKSVEVTNSKKGQIDFNSSTSTFTMPEGTVTIKATFVSSTAYAINTTYKANGKDSNSNTVGSIIYQVDGQTVTSAREGDKVTMVINAKSGYSYDSNYTTVKFSNNSSTVSSFDTIAGTFTMPGTAVTVSTNFVSGAYSIKHGIEEKNGTFTYSVNGNSYSTTTCQKGDTIYIYPNPAQNYKVKAVQYAYYETATATKDKVFDITKTGKVENKAVWTFAVPEIANSNKTIWISVYYELDDTYSISTELYKDTITGAALSNTDEYATIKTSVGGVAVDNTTPKNTVTVNITPVDGYKVATDASNGDLVEVSYKTNGSDAKAEVKTVTQGSTYTFVMPSDIKANTGITVKAAISAITYDITATLQNGKIECTVGTGSDKVTSAAFGDTVTATITPADGYSLKSLKVLDNSGNTISAKAVSSTTYQFTMPASDVTIIATYEKAQLAITKGTMTNGDVQILVDEAEATTAGAGDTVTIVPKPGVGYKCTEIKTEPATTVTKLSNGNYTFTMPSSATTVTATFTAATYDITYTKSSRYTVTVTGATANGDYWTSEYGKEITVTVAPAATGTTIDSVQYNGITINNTKTDGSFEGTFTMPAGDVKLEIATNAKIVNINNLSNGRVSIASTAVVGTNVEFAITPKSEELVYEVVAMQGETEIYKKTTTNITSDSFTVTGDGDITIEAKVAYHVGGTLTNGTSSSKPDNGYTADGMTHYYAAGTTKVTMNLQANAGYEFSEDSLVFKDLQGNIISKTSLNLNFNKEKGLITSFDFTMPDCPVTFTAEFVPFESAYITVLAKNSFDSLNLATGNGIQIVNAGTTMSLNANSRTEAAIKVGNDVTLTIVTEKGWTIAKGTDDYATAKAALGIPASATVEHTVGTNTFVFKFKMPSTKIELTADKIKSVITEYESGLVGETRQIIVSSAITGGKVTTSPTLASKDTTVTITATPDTGKVVSEVKVTKNSDSSVVSHTQESATVYTFTMPDEDVTVSVTFKDTTT